MGLIQSSFFVHRNTLVYRLEKIKKLTGLDLRQFDHAIVFKVALMVRKYLSSRETRAPIVHTSVDRRAIYPDIKYAREILICH